MTESDSGSDDDKGQITTPVENPDGNGDGSNTNPSNPETPKATYTITFDANGGTGTIASITEVAGTEITLSENTFTKDGWIFAGWATSADGDVSYSDKAKITVTSNITLYAKWELLAANAASVIAELAEGEHTVIVVGNISETLDDIANAIKSNSKAKINLDLSKTTGLTSIGYATFQDCNSLVSVNIPDSVTSIDMNAFYKCTNLTSVIIPDGVTFIGVGAFSSCTSLTSINIPNSVTYFLYNVFMNCDSLKFNEFDNAKYIGNESNPYLVLIEAKDKNITSCNINTATKIIAGYAFRSCSNLTSVNIPASVTFIADSAFQYCDSLTTVNYRGTEEQWKAITIEPRNELLTGATINYSYTVE